MLRNIFNTIASKISNLNPIKQFIKYALDKTLNQFLKKQLTLEDFKNGPLNLQNIQINTQKINVCYLVSSPYIMHSGVIGNLKITLPPLSQLSTQSIEISVSQVQVTLKPNKKFAENFKQKMVQRHEMEKYDVQEEQMKGQISQTGPVDFFKQLLKNIIMNIKVNITNIAIKLYMNTPSQDKNSPQFYLMLRVPIIYLDKKQQKKIKNAQSQQINFNVLLPQISVHLLSQDLKFPDYSNMPYKQQDFPLKYPTVNHPKTILLIGSADITQNFFVKLPEWKKNGSINCMNFTQIGFKLVTDYKKKTKEVNLHLKIANIQSMVTPTQIKILSRFVAQIMEFKKILDLIIKQLRAESMQSVGMSRRKSKNDIHKSSSNDLFSSIMMSLSQDMTNVHHQGHHRESSNMFKSIKEDKIMRESIREFNMEFQKQMSMMKGTQSMTIQFQAIQFKQTVKIQLQLTSLYLYILKYSPKKQFMRIWRRSLNQLDNNNEQLDFQINTKIPADYFLFAINTIDVKVKVKQKQTTVNIKNLKVQNVVLSGRSDLEKIDVNGSGDGFFDIRNSLDFQASKYVDRNQADININSANQLAQFTIHPPNHFCIQELVSISQAQTPPMAKNQAQTIYKYSMMPKLHQPDFLYRAAIQVYINTKQKCNKINFQVITVSVNLQIVLDFLNIAFPLLAYKRLADIVNFKRAEMGNNFKDEDPGKEFNRKKDLNQKNIFQSIYQYRVDDDFTEESKNQSKNKNTLVIQIAQAKIGFRKGQICKTTDKKTCDSNFTNLIKRQKQRLYEQQCFPNECFCKINQKGVYLQLQSLKFQKKLSTLKLSCKALDVGLMTIKNSAIKSLSSILSIKSQASNNSIRILRQFTYCQSLSIFVPELAGKLTEQEIIQFVQLALDSAKIVANVIEYKNYLTRQMMLLENRVEDYQKKKNKKNQSTLQKQTKIFIQKVGLQLQYLNLTLQQIFLQLTPHKEQIIALKLSKIIAGVSRRQYKVKLGQFVKNGEDLLTNEYPEQFTRATERKIIADCDVFLEMWDREKPEQGSKMEDRHTLFQKLDKMSFCFVFKFIKKETQRAYQINNINKQSNFSDNKMMTKWSNQGVLNSGLPVVSSQPSKFTFKNKKYSSSQSSISQQSQNKILQVHITHNINLYLCNALQLKNQLKKIQKLTKILNNKINQTKDKLKSQSLGSMIERKESVQIQSQSIQLKVRIGAAIVIDIWPEFIRNQWDRVLANSRSVINIYVHDTLNILIDKDKNQKNIKGEFSLSYYFLHFSDRQPSLNPLLLPQQKHLTELGFKPILQISKLSLYLKLYSSNNKTINLSVRSILGEASIQTLSLMQLHFEYLLKHHLSGDIGISRSEIYDGDDFCTLQYDAETDPDFMGQDEIIVVGGEMQELEIEDLSGALQLYQQKLNTKNKQQSQIRSRALVFNQLPNPDLTLQDLFIEKMCFRITCLNDFDFIKSNSSNDKYGNSNGGIGDRRRVKDTQDLQCYVLLSSSLHVDLDLQTVKSQNQGANQLKDKQEKKEIIISSFIKMSKLKVLMTIQNTYSYSNLKHLQQFIAVSSQSQQTNNQNFTIFNSENEFGLVFEMTPQRIIIKSYNLKLDIGGTTQIVSAFKQLKKISQQIEKSGWKKMYKEKVQQKKIQKPKKQGQSIKKQKTINQRIVLLIPDSVLRVTFQYANLLKIVDDQTLQLKQFLLNQELIEKYQIKRRVKKWLKGLVKNNIGSVLSGTALNLLVKLFSHIISLNIRWLSSIFGFFFSAND